MYCTLKQGALTIIEDDIEGRKIICINHTTFYCNFTTSTAYLMR